MDFSDVNNQFFTANVARMSSQRNNSARPNLAATSNRIPESRDSFQKKKASEDGKFSYWEYGKNMIKGVGQFAVDIVKNVVKNPVISLASVALFGSMASTPLGLLLLSGMGLASVMFGGALLGIKSANLALDGKWDELEKTGKDLGKLIPATVISAFGALKGTKLLSGAIPSEATKTTGLMTSMEKAVELDARVTWAFLKNIYNSGKNFIKNPKDISVSRAVNGGKSFRDGVKADYEIAIKNLNKNIYSEAERTFLNSEKAKLFDFNYSHFKETMPVTIKELGDT